MTPSALTINLPSAKRGVNKNDVTFSLRNLFRNKFVGLISDAGFNLCSGIFPRMVKTILGSFVVTKNFRNLSVRKYYQFM